MRLEYLRPHLRGRGRVEGEREEGKGGKENLRRKRNKKRMVIMMMTVMKTMI